MKKYLNVILVSKASYLKPKMRKIPYLFLLLFLNILPGVAQDILVHDPVMAKQGDNYYIFCTGMGITVYSSKDMVNWKSEKPVFDKAPQWALDAIPGFKGHIWAPDISFHNGLYYLYYSVSAFGKNTSCIGVATNKTLDPQSKDFKWTDHGKVIQSVPGRDLWNAIDPNLAFDDNNVPYLVFGSFWSGMKQVKLKDNLKEVAEPQEWRTISKRPRDFKVEDSNPGEAAVEAPFIFKKNGYYYLFVSFDFCCRGLESNYKIVIGRSKTLQGPFLDKEGKRMDEGGGSILLEGNKHWNGLGHNSAYTFDGTDYLVFHAYDGTDGGKPKLKIRKMNWDSDNWPVVTLE
jgi:arabinan endo-1,5-alpha-L-arabinosidase